MLFIFSSFAHREYFADEKKKRMVFFFSSVIPF